jgi:hypothetical protein
VRLIGRDHDFIGQFLKGLEIKGAEKKKKKYSVNRFADEQEYNKSIKEKGGD